jgi:transmembrane sensor
MGTVALLAVVVVALQGLRGRPIATRGTPAEGAPAMVSPPSRSVQLEDGSRATLFADAAIAFPATEAGVTAVQLVSGVAQFEVIHNEKRAFRVIVGDVVVEDIGTAFTVERSDDVVLVTVERGRVRVTSPGTRVELGAGETRSFEQPLHPHDIEAPAAASGDTPHGAVAKEGQDFRALARQGDYDRAYESLRHQSVATLSDSVEDLLQAADVARLSRHPEQAVTFLKIVIKRHSQDPRAPLASFTLGRVLLDYLGRPREAADAFAEARAHNPSGALAEDALAREVEGWSRAGELDRARARAEEYLKRYPKGRRVSAVRRHAGLE